MWWQSDEFMTDVQRKAFEKIGDAEAEMDIVDDTGSERFDGIV